MNIAMLKKKKIFVLSCIYWSFANVAFAIENQPVELSTVTVSAGRGASLEKMDASTTTMTREQVQQSPETTVEQILNKIPGVFSPQVPANQIHPTGEVFSIRGFGTTTNINTLVMVDGVPVNDPYFRILNWGQIPKDTIERIEVIRGGGASSLWGNLAMGGIVNIVLRQPAEGESRANMSYGSFNTKTLGVAQTLYSNDAWKVGVNLNGTTSDGYNQTPAEFRNPNMMPTSSQSGNMLVSAYYSPNQDAKYYIKAYGSRSQEKGLVWNNTSNAWSNYQLTGGGTSKLDGGASINMNGWVNKGEMDTQNAGQTPAFSILNPGVGKPYVSQVERAKYNSLGGSLFYQNDLWIFKESKIGLDVRDIKANDDESFYSATTHTADILAEGEHRFEGLFAQGVYRPDGMPLDVTVGVRQDMFQTVNGSITNTIAGAGTVNGLANASYQQFDPRIGAKYYFESGLDIRAAAYRNFAAPGMNQMYRSTQSGTSYLAPNPGLTPQSNVGQELGFDYKRPGMNVAFTLFNNQLSNYIDYAPICTSLAACAPMVAGTGFGGVGITRVNQYVNAGDANIKGVELIGEWQSSELLLLNGGITRTIAYLTRSVYPNAIGTTPAPDPVNVQLGQVPEWMATLGATWQATSDLKLMLMTKTFPTYWNNTAHTQLNDAATIADIAFNYRVNKKVEAYGSVQNIGNRSYYDSGLITTTANGSTISGSGIPAQGMALNATLGMRVAF